MNLAFPFLNLFYNKEADVCFCLLSAPDKVAVENHHHMIGVTCEMITEVLLAKKYSLNLIIL